MWHTHQVARFVGRRAIARSFASVGSQIPSVELHSRVWMLKLNIVHEASRWRRIIICGWLFVLEVFMLLIYPADTIVLIAHKRLTSYALSLMFVWCHSLENFPPEKMWVPNGIWSILLSCTARKNDTLHIVYTFICSPNGFLSQYLFIYHPVLIFIISQQHSRLLQKQKCSHRRVTGGLYADMILKANPWLRGETRRSPCERGEWRGSRAVTDHASRVFFLLKNTTPISNVFFVWWFFRLGTRSHYPRRPWWVNTLKFQIPNNSKRSSLI